MNKEEAERIIAQHELWLNSNGTEGERAHFDKQIIRGFTINDVNLSRAFFTNSDLRGTFFHNVNLEAACFNGAELGGVLFRESNLERASFFKATLLGTQFIHTNLNSVDFSYSKLLGASIVFSRLNSAKFTGVNLKKNIIDSEIIDKTSNLPYTPLACPDTGSFIAWKKANEKIIKLLIPEDAKRVSSLSNKCRANKAIVLEIQNLDGTPSIFDKVGSDYDPNFVYKIGETVSVDNFKENRWIECAPGVHFFINRQEAVDY